jgi:hypothetical protein
MSAPATRQRRAAAAGAAAAAPPAPDLDAMDGDGDGDGRSSDVEDEDELDVGGAPAVRPRRSRKRKQRTARDQRMWLKDVATVTKLLDAMEMLPEAEQRGKIAELEKALRGLKREDHDDIARGRDKAHALKAARQELSQQKRREAAEAAAERESAAKALLAEITGLDPAEQLQKKGALSEALKGLRAKDGETWLAEARETLKDLTARERAANTTRSASRSASAAAPPARRWAKHTYITAPLVRNEQVGVLRII